MSDARVSLRLIGDSRDYQPGEKLTGEYFVEVARASDVRAVEVSVLWYTEGKGDEDLAVHFFQRTTSDEAGDIDLRATQHFSTSLPNTPVSYDGVLLKIRWCVRVRAFLPRGRELVAEEGFRLGSVPRAQAIQEDAVSEGEGDVDLLNADTLDSDTAKAASVTSAETSAASSEGESEAIGDSKNDTPKPGDDSSSNDATEGGKSKTD